MKKLLLRISVPPVVIIVLVSCIPIWILTQVFIPEIVTEWYIKQLEN